MKYIYSLLINLLFISLCFAQKTEYHISLGSNISFSSFNDRIYSYPPISPTTGFFSYSQLPDNIYRKTIPKLGLQLQGDVFYNLYSKFSIGTGLKFLLYRHGYDQEFEENPFDPYGKRWSNGLVYQSPPTILASLSDNIKHTRIMYLSIPIQVNYQTNTKIDYYMGVNVSTPLFVAQKYKSFSFNQGNSFSETDFIDNQKSAFNRINYGIQLGIGYNTSTYTSIKINLNHNINNTYSDIRENNDIKSLMRTINLSYDCLLDL